MKFKYLDKVRVIKGFYREQEGTVVNINIETHYFKPNEYVYTIKLPDDVFIYYDEDKLELKNNVIRIKK